MIRVPEMVLFLAPSNNFSPFSNTSTTIFLLFHLKIRVITTGDITESQSQVIKHEIMISLDLPPVAKLREEKITASLVLG